MTNPDHDRIAELERKLASLEQQYAALRDFAVPALWNALDRLEDQGQAPEGLSCLACGQSSPIANFALRVDECIFGGGRLLRHECPLCGCVFGPQKYLCAPESVIAADYELLYSHYSEGDSTEQELRAFELLEPQKDRLYLNWGSGAWSRSVEILRAKGYDVWGFEPHARGDSPYVVSRREEVSARFDGIFSNNVIEHFFRPAEQFLDFRTVLKDSGKMVHASPCYEWSYAYTRFHVFFPLGGAARALADRTGFTLSTEVSDGEFQARVFSLLA